MRQMVVLAMTLCVGAAGCDDTLFGVGRGGDGIVEPVYTSDWEGVEDMFAASCQHCHPGVHPFVLADVEADLASSAGEYIVAGDPEASLFYRLISGERRDGDPTAMPQGTTGLPADEYEHVRLWILDGAPLPGDTDE